MLRGAVGADVEGKGGEKENSGGGGGVGSVCGDVVMGDVEGDLHCRL